MREAIYQPTHLTGLSGQKDYSLYAVRRQNTLQGFRLGENAGGEL